MITGLIGLSRVVTSKPVVFLVVFLAAFGFGLWTDSVIQREFFPQNVHQVTVQDNKFKKSQGRLSIELKEVPRQEGQDKPDTVRIAAENPKKKKGFLFFGRKKRGGG